MADLNELKPVGKLNPFAKFCCTIGNLPTSYMISLTYEEQLIWLCNYLEKTVIPAVNTNAEAVQELQELYVVLQNYVDNYFENLDVQEEINNKLDDMAESGQLQQIISNIFDEIEEQIGDLNKLNTIDNSNIVNAINNTDYNQALNLGRSIIYDIPKTNIGHVQASCVHDNLLYVTVQGGTSFPNGDILVFNIETNTYVGIYENIPFYHANDITYLNGKLYIIELDTHKIGVYDISSGTYTTINTLQDYTIKPIGIERYNDKLLVWGGDIVVEPNHIGDYTINNDVFYLLNPISLEVEKTYTINNPYKLLEFYPYNLSGIAIVRQCFTIYNNTLFVLFQQPNVILKCAIEENTIKPLKFYNIPFYDRQNGAIGETEGISVIDNDYYPDGTIMLTTRTNQYYKNGNVFSHDVLSCYTLNTFLNSTYFNDMAYGYFQRGNNNTESLSVSKTASNNSLIEIGSSAFPFKDLIRAMNYVNVGNEKMKIYIRDSSTYYLPYLFGYNVEICVANNEIHPVIYIGDIENSKISFWSDRTNSSLTIKALNDNKRINILNSEINTLSNNNDIIIFEDTQIALNNSIFKSRRTKFNNTISVSSGYAIQVFDGSIFTDGFATVQLSGTDKFVQTGSAGVAWLQPAESHTYTKISYSSLNFYN